MKLDHIHNGDCLEWLRRLPDESIDAVITDPPWANCAIDTGWGGNIWWQEIVGEIERVVGGKGKILIHLNSSSDPRIYLEAFRRPFVHMCWLSYAVPRYRGNILNCADVVYQFGRGFLPRGRKVLTQEFRATSKGQKDSEHPCPRNLQHLVGLLRSQVGPGRTVLDPFAGSGTTLVAAKMLGIKYLGCEINSSYIAMAEKRLDEVAGVIFSRKTGEPMGRQTKLF